MTTHSTNEAMALLKTYRAFLIKRGQWEGAQLAAKDGTVTSRDVRAAMEKAGLLTGDISDYWLGAVFHNGPFAWTGGYQAYSDPSRNIHERTVKVWKLSARYAPSRKPVWAHGNVPALAPVPLPKVPMRPSWAKLKSPLPEQAPLANLPLFKPAGCTPNNCPGSFQKCGCVPTARGLCPRKL
jgi:hypothetical protein